MSVVGNAILLGGENLPDAGGVSFGGTYAFIRVIYPSGSTCTCTNGNTILVAEDTSGSYTFAVEMPASGTDTWTVSCMDGTDSSSNTVNITSSSRIQSVELVYISLITFYITYTGNTYEMTAESGMTWVEFVSSSYNSPPPPLYAISDGRVSNTINWEPMTVYLTYQGYYIHSTDEIVAGRYYDYTNRVSDGSSN